MLLSRRLVLPQGRGGSRSHRKFVSLLVQLQFGFTLIFFLFLRTERDLHRRRRKGHQRVLRSFWRAPLGMDALG